MKRDVTQALIEQFGEEVVALGDSIFGQGYFRDEPTFVIEPAKIAEVCAFLKDTAGLEFKMLADIAGVDYYQQPLESQWGRFAANYHLLSIRWNQRVRLKVFWSEGDPAIPSVVGLWQSANWEEREAYDMFGIPFDGHPDLRRILMPEDWQGHPQRKDYPLGYETVQFSFNYDEISQHKPFAKE